MKTKQGFVLNWEGTPATNGNTMYADALAVMESLEAQIPTPKFKVRDRVHRPQYGHKGKVLEVVEVVTGYRITGTKEPLRIFPESELEPAPIEPPTIEEFVKAYMEEGWASCETLIARYKAWKESQNA